MRQVKQSTLKKTATVTNIRSRIISITSGNVTALIGTENDVTLTEKKKDTLDTIGNFPCNKVVHYLKDND